jgi:hypothetical protein
MPFHVPYDELGEWHPPGRHITVGHSPRGVRHAVVYDGLEPIYDPTYPVGQGLVTVEGVYLMHRIERGTPTT